VVLAYAQERKKEHFESTVMVVFVGKIELVLKTTPLESSSASEEFIQLIIQ
jgi:hypothetical protein